MEIAIIYMVVLLMLCALGFGLIKISKWHQLESNYWESVHFQVILEPARDEFFRPVLQWAKANPPSILERLLRPWRDPQERMARSR